MGEIRVGTSGWHYDHWRGTFYPPGLPVRRFFEYYGTVFRTVEVNSSFYRLPSEETVEAWCAAAPPGFMFAVKASRFITHRKKLIDPTRTLPALIDRARLFGKKLGPILFQLPPRFRRDEARLSAFLEVLPAGYRYAMEFRDPSWFDTTIDDLLSRRGVAFCIFELGDLLSPRRTTADFVYVRLHGPRGPYRGSYPRAALEQWAGQFDDWTRQGMDVFCYFDNDESGYAAQNARTLLEIAGVR
jgi:uncharacterized protein YecE (DUF72 family)